MTREENIAFMKDFFEKYYEQLRNEDEVLVAGVKIPEEMVDHDLQADWKVWKLIPSTVTEADLSALEERLHIKLPECLRAFLSVYHHRFDGPVGRNEIDAPFESFERTYTHNLAENGYLPFGWDSEGYYIRCIDLTNMPDEEHCPVVQVDHEPFFDLQYEYSERGKTVPKEELEPLIEEVSENFYEYLNAILSGELDDYDEDEDFDDEDFDDDDDFDEF